MYHIGYPFDYAVPARPSSTRRNTDQPEQQSRGRDQDQTTHPRPRMPSRSRTTKSIMHTGYPFDYAVPAQDLDRPSAPARRRTEIPEQESRGRTKDQPTDSRPRMPSRNRTSKSIMHTGYPFDYAVQVPTQNRSPASTRRQTEMPSSPGYPTERKGRGRSKSRARDSRQRSKSRTRETRSGREPFLNVYAGEHLLEDQNRGRSRSHSRTTSHHQASPSRSRYEADLLAAARPDLLDRPSHRQIRPYQSHQEPVLPTHQVPTPDRRRRNASSHRFDNNMWQAGRPDLVESQARETERRIQRWQNDMWQAGRPDLSGRDQYGGQYRPRGGY